ncbi:MAG: tetratricopeptide repeat protein [Bacteroidales bacterium]|nr:tetratricopeptide repeat protein [Bacteroidales bacterium]
MAKIKYSIVVIMIFTMSGYRITFLFLLSVMFMSVNGQDAASSASLNVRGVSELDMEPLPGATATLYEGGKRINSVRTGTDGRFSFTLEVNRQYTIEISKEGLISKRISFNTTMPDEEKGVWTSEFSMGLVRFCDGVDYSILDEPVDVVEFDAGRREFVSNKEYVSRMRPKIEDVLMDYETCMLDKYDAAMRKADQAYARKEYQEAISEYNAALEIYPDEKLPGKRIAEIETLIEDERNTDEAYDRAIAQADALFERQKFTEALSKYREASALKPRENYPKEKISASEAAYSVQQAELNEQRDREDAYNLTLAKAGTAYTQKDYSKALEYYQAAAEIKPSEALPKTRLEEIHEILEKKAAEEASIRKIDDAYRNAIAEAEALVNSGDYDAARQKYAYALTVKPAEAYPKTKMTEIDRIVEAQARAEENAKKALMEKEYQSVLTEADRLYRNKDYEGARAAYVKALEVKPSEPFPRQRITAIENAVAAEQAAQQMAVEKEYQAAITAANAALSQKNYVEAVSLLNRALEYRPDDPFAMKKLNETDILIAEQERNQEMRQHQDEQYNDALLAGDQFLARKEYDNARQQFQRAMEIKPGDPVARKMLTQIEEILLAEKTAVQREFELSYSAAMTKGVESLTKKNYADAGDAFREALAIKPDDVSAKQKLNETERVLSLEAQRLVAETEKKQNYDEVVMRGDGLFAGKEYSGAKQAYEDALRIIPGEPYPRQKITEINQIIEEQDQLLQELQAVENTYQKALTYADNYYEMKDYAGAREEYIRAAEIKPDETYARERLEEVEELIRVREIEQAEVSKRADAYAATISKANDSFNKKKYQDARSSYNLALQLIPGDVYAKEQIARIDRITTMSSRSQSSEAEGQATLLSATAPDKLEFSSDQEKDNYFEELRRSYPGGITLEIYREEYKETLRYIVIRNDIVNEFRKLRFLTFGQEEYSVNGKPITEMYFLSQIKQREGEQYKEIVMQ